MTDEEVHTCIGLLSVPHRTTCKADKQTMARAAEAMAVLLRERTSLRKQLDGVRENFRRDVAYLRSYIR